MANERCPSCGASVRAGDPWCTLCWTDLRTAPPAPVMAAPVLAAPVGAAVATADPLTDPLTAPLAVVLGEAPQVDQVDVTWPCVECGARNVLDAETCAVCAAPFGGRITRLDDPKGERRKLMMYGLSFVGALLLILGLLTFAMTKVPDEGGGASVDPKIDWSSIPRD